jgi:predicted DCC family thiol-disulfide oxidoreductase YuxK
VFREAYAAVGLGWLVAPTGWPILRPLFDVGYRWFARNRVRLGRIFGRRCEDGRCAIPGDR